MNIESFLIRIGVQSLPESPLNRLQALHRAMTQTVPFENLAVLEGQKISLDPETLFTKIVERGRGGYCFELNTMLAEVLDFMGYKVERLLGRVWANGAASPPLTHMTLKVTVENQSYLCDVGFGGGTLREPLPWNTGAIVNQSSDSFRLDKTDNAETMLSRLTGDSWKNLYSLLPCVVRVQDYIPANHYTSTHPDSYFTQGPVAALTTEDGRITLRGRIFRSVGANREEERELATFDELIQVLSRDFGLDNLDVKNLKSRLSGLFLQAG
ncbi:arylamine N-acetyltransferase family protein [Pelobacter propionicus]|uniref:N-acetyltransferase n=1 Tax=Pelobacter propionicus (strain DSM 2379 / NBRC 103807 / OttBd1) TaxID=338966 RepID=A1AQ99_PELPD|nr:arylamine N-acetyltransferase [Pelobacter propionicus]ABK99519.1 N-acetyltransferase [Pelobacter propionicus DSM 2379]